MIKLTLSFIALLTILNAKGQVTLEPFDPDDAKPLKVNTGSIYEVIVSEELKWNSTNAGISDHWAVNDKVNPVIDATGDGTVDVRLYTTSFSGRDYDEPIMVYGAVYDCANEEYESVEDVHIEVHNHHTGETLKVDSRNMAEMFMLTKSDHIVNKINGPFPGRSNHDLYPVSRDLTSTFIRVVTFVNNLTGNSDNPAAYNALKKYGFKPQDLRRLKPNATDSEGEFELEVWEANSEAVEEAGGMVEVLEGESVEDVIAQIGNGEAQIVPETEIATGFSGAGIEPAAAGIALGPEALAGTVAGVEGGSIATGTAVITTVILTGGAVVAVAGKAWQIIHDYGDDDVFEPGSPDPPTDPVVACGVEVVDDDRNIKKHSALFLYLKIAGNVAVNSICIPGISLKNVDSSDTETMTCLQPTVLTPVFTNNAHTN